MAPSMSWAPRQDSVPTCVTTCMASGDTTGCTSLTDFACLCTSTPYLSSVATCLGGSCNATDAAIGQAFASQACASYGVTIPGTDTNSTANATQTTSSDSAASSTAALPLDTTTAPKLYHQDFVNMQAIMSSICTALLLLAICLGVLACRSRLRKNRNMTQNRSWTGMNSSMDTKSPSKYGFSRTGGGAGGGQSSSRAVSRPFSETDTFDNFGISSAPGTMSLPVPPPLTFSAMRGSVNRGEEEWEMETKGSGEKREEGEPAMAESPTTFTTRGGPGGSEVELGAASGSTVHLTGRESATHTGRAF